MANKYKLKFTLSDGNTIDAGKIVVPEGAKGDKGDKGDPYTLTSTDKAAIVQDVLAALPYYDGSVTISGGVEPSGHTVNISYDAAGGVPSSAEIGYSLDDGATWNTITSNLVLNNVTQIKFRGKSNGDAVYPVMVGLRDVSDILLSWETAYTYSDNLVITEDCTFYAYLANND